jgi:hypothetical protein
VSNGIHSRIGPRTLVVPLFEILMVSPLKGDLVVRLALDGRVNVTFWMQRRYFSSAMLLSEG